MRFDHYDIQEYLGIAISIVVLVAFFFLYKSCNNYQEHSVIEKKYKEKVEEHKSRLQGERFKINRLRDNYVYMRDKDTVIVVKFEKTIYEDEELAPLNEY